MAEDPPASTQAPVTTAVATGGVAATQSSMVASTNLTQAVSTPLVTSQIQLQALQAALQAAQISSGGGLVTQGSHQTPSKFPSSPLVWQCPDLSTLGPCLAPSLASLPLLSWMSTPWPGS